jgi:hypothetical protein
MFEFIRSSIRRRSFVIALSALLFTPLFVATHALAQLDQGAITGVVQDDSGANIPHAAVTLTDTDTGLVLKSTADASGVFTFSPIKIGNYKVTAVMAGFSTTTQEHIHVDVQERVNIPLVLKNGAVTENVTVSAAPPLLQTQSSQVGQVIDTETINDIPLNGRNAVYAAFLTAGVVQGVGGRGVGNGDFSANGQRPTQNNYILDGVDNNTAVPDFLNGSSFVVNPPPDALAEFNVQTSDYSAELGHSAGAVLNTATKSGTNNIHGDLWEYNRNTIFDARDFNVAPGTVQPYHENQFGATLGAPILRDKLFFFGYLENNRIVFNSATTLSVPTALMRQGNFSELLNPALTANGVAIPLYQAGSAGTVPLTCNGQANVLCNPNAIAQRLLNLYPLPNTNNGKLVNNYTETIKDVSNTFQWGTRFDWNISSKDQAFVRFSYLNNPGSYTPPLGPILDGGAYGTDDQIINQADNLALSETHLFSPRLINEFRLGVNYGNFGFVQGTFNDPGLAASLGLGGIPSGGKIGGGLPLVTLTGLTGFGQPGFLPNHKNEDVIEFLDNVTLIRGNHSIKFGVLFQSVRLPFFSPPNGRGTYVFGGFFTSKNGAANTGYGAADFLSDATTTATVPNFQSLDIAHWTRSGYVQDDWRVTPKLTLNLGLRYEFFQPAKEVAGHFASLYSTESGPGTGTATLTYPQQQASSPLPAAFLTLLAANKVNIAYTPLDTLVTTQNTNFSPRVGFAYSFNDKTTIHGGYGVFFGGVENSGGTETLQNYPYQFTLNFPRPTCVGAGNCPTNGITLENGFSTYLAAGLINTPNSPSFAGSQPHIQNPYTESYNLAVQRSITNDIVATVSYVGDVTRHLFININANAPAALVPSAVASTTVQPFPGLGAMNTNFYVGNSNYNALQTKLEKRMSHGTTFLATYTYAHSLDDADQNLAGNTYRGVNLIGVAADYSNSSFDVRQRFTFNAIYELPFGEGRHFLNHRGILNELVGGWSTDLQFSAQTGFPFNVAVTSAAPNGGTAYAIRVADPYATGGTPPPNNPKITCATQTRTLQHWYNPCAFDNPPTVPTTAGTVIVGAAAAPYLGGPPLSMYGPGYERINMSIFKNFATFREQYLQFRADAFNVLNTPAYGNPSTANNSTNGGLITAPRTFQALTPDSRFFQFAAKYVF